ncbi:hypothetical protein OG2516_13209 [Oceanicola granulosus HTCC2516]|uniref:Uncharacterized protein n=2 Tax=Oceanicola granulosus TaxID=252302 RepID=Q2CH26_OCEGH|nr:hypothetical protein OG2516_13209 [Oceanicola granulosus HTCC2516]
MVVLDEVVIRVAREGQRIEPEGVDRRFGKLRQPRSHGCQMRQIMAQDVMSNEMPDIAKVGLQPIQRDRPFLASQCRPVITAHRRQVKYARRFWIDLKIDRQASRQEWIRLVDGL